MDEKTVRRVKIITISAVVVFFVLVIALMANVISVISLRVRRNKLQSEYDRINSNNEQLQSEIEYKSTDTYIEQYAREVLGMVKDGETVIVSK